jgi:hypothetical protein
MKGLENYKLDKAFTEGVEIRLDDAPDTVFLVKLPSQYNRGYTQALYSGLEWDIGEDGEVKTGGSLIATRYAQEDAFMQFCLETIDGEPVPDNFLADYPAAVAELMAKTNDLVQAIEEKVSKSVGKSSASSSGKKGGQEKSSSTSSLSREAS